MPSKLKTKASIEICTEEDRNIDVGCIIVRAKTRLGDFYYCEDVLDEDVDIRIKRKEIPGDFFNDFDYPNFDFIPRRSCKLGVPLRKQLEIRAAKEIDKWLDKYEEAKNNPIE